LSEEIDGLIESKEAELSSLRMRMDELRKEFARETAVFAREWYRETAKDYVSKYPEVTLGLSAEKIVAMKAQVNMLVKSAEKIVQSEFDNPALWWHMEPHLHESVDRYMQFADKYPEVIDRAVRRALGHLGIVLENFGFHVTVSGYTGTYYEFWFERPISGREAVPCYPHLLSWTEDMQKTIRKYDGQYVEAVKIYDEIHRLKEEKKKIEALTLWDSV
jgi:hypothetical protein